MELSGKTNTRMYQEKQETSIKKSNTKAQRNYWAEDR